MCVLEVCIAEFCWIFVVTENCVKNSSFARRMTSLNMNRKNDDYSISVVFHWLAVTCWLSIITVFMLTFVLFHVLSTTIIRIGL